MRPDPEAKRERAFWVLTFLLASLPLLGWWLYGLFDLDEGFYASVTREMLRTGDWITPRLNGEPWFEKPILLYWLAAPAVAVFGENVGPRLPSILASLGLYVMVGSFVAPRLTSVTARWAVVILATSPIMAIFARMMMTDSLFVLFLSASFLALYRSLFDGWKWRLVSGLMLGLAVLAKGPVAIIFWGMMLAVTAWRQPTMRRAVFDIRGNTAALLGLLAAVSIWYLPAYLANSELFVQKFLIEQNVARFFGGDKAHAVPWYLHPIYFPVVLGVGMIPWSWRIIEGWPKKIEEGESGSTFLQFCAHWALIVVVFFTLSGSKLPHYVLPAAVPLAILFARTIPSVLFGIGTLLWGVAHSLLLNFAGIYYYEVSGQRELHELCRWLRAQPEQVAFYRPRARTQSGTFQLGEIGSPSIGFYLDRSYIAADSLDKLAARGNDILVLARAKNITPLDTLHLTRAGHSLKKVTTAPVQMEFSIYRLEP